MKQITFSLLIFLSLFTDVVNIKYYSLDIAKNKNESCTYAILASYRLVSGMRPKSRSRRQILLNTTVHSRTEVQFYVETFLARRILGRILIQHYHNLRHVVQLRHH